MILEGFEIDNWSCIKHLAVDGLPPQGVAVLYGPNGRGKSSIIEALRACLMDKKSTSKALERGISKQCSEKPRVSVTFRTGQTSWRIMKVFNSKESRLESRMSTGQWKVETVDPTEAHERVRELTGGCDSTRGLHQLLWLTQAEFRLPEPKQFDADVQSRLRGLLGALRTSLDDRFLHRVKEGWLRWFSARAKHGKKPDLKDSCLLAKNLTTLDLYKTTLRDTEVEFADVEEMVRRSIRLEIEQRDLKEQLVEALALRNEIQREYERSLARIEAHRLANERLTSANDRLNAALEARRQRTEKEQQASAAQDAASASRTDAEEKARLILDAERALRETQTDLDDLRLTGNRLQARKDRVDERIRFMDLRTRTGAARDKLQLGELAAQEFEALNQQNRDHPAPDATTLTALKENRESATTLRANLEAASLALTLSPKLGASPLHLIVDAGNSEEVVPTAGEECIHRAIRRQVVLELPGWGRAEITRGSDSRSLEQMEKELGDLDATFAEQAAPFGIASLDPNALEILRQLAADRDVRLPLIEQKRKEIKRLAPKGIEVLRVELAQLENLFKAAKSQDSPTTAGEELPDDLTKLESLSETLRNRIAVNASAIQTGDNDRLAKQMEIDGAAETDPTTRPTKTGTVEVQTRKLGLRAIAESARTAYADADATARLLRRQLAESRSDAEISMMVKGAQDNVAAALLDLEQAKLSSNEETVLERLKIAREGVESIQDELRIKEKDLTQITAVLGTKGGLHQRRAEALARVEEYTRLTERETLESDTYHRLLELFEECRVEQFSAVVRPIHDRVLGWMRLAGIAGYQAVQFNDQCLPERLAASDGTYDISLLEESHGTQEQIGIMVRLALGATLATPNEPVVAILDDPLTHGDSVRLDRMRAIIRKAAAGDSGLSPPAGPLQILVFTCHPERFRKSADVVIDLEDPAVMTRFGV